MDLTKCDKIYSSLLYQLVSSVSLENDKQKLSEFTDYLKDVFSYSNATHQTVLDEVRALPKPNRICDLTIIEAIDLQLDVIPTETPPRLFVTATFDGVHDDEIQHTKITKEMEWNETISIVLDEAKMNDSLVVRIWNNYYRKEESVIGQKFFVGPFHKKVTPSSSIHKVGKRASYILGKATIPIKAITPSTTFTWPIIDKKDSCLRKSLIKLKVEYTLKENEHFFPESSVEYAVLFENLLRYELKDCQASGYWWNEKFTKLGQHLLEHYSKSKQILSKPLVKLIQWQVACKVQGKDPLAYSLLHEIVDEISTFIRNSICTDEQLSLFWSSCVPLLENSVTMIREFEFDNEKRITNLLKTLYKISSIVLMSKKGLLAGDMFKKDPVNDIDKRARDSIEPLINEAMKENVKLWFEAIVNMGITGQNEEDWFVIHKNFNEFELEKLCHVLTKMQERLYLVKDVYAVPFKTLMNINLLELYITELDSLFTNHVTPKLQTISQSIDFDIDSTKSNYDEQKSLHNQLTHFYMKLKGLNETLVDVLLPSKSLSLISGYHKWFDNYLSLWFKVLGIEARKGIVKAVKLDEKLNLDGSSHTSSAADTFDLLYVLIIKFKQIVSVEHDKVFWIASEIVSEMSESCLTYFEEASRALTPHWSKKSGEATLEKPFIEKFTDVIKNVEYLSKKVSGLIAGIYIQILSAENTMITNKKYPGLADLRSNLDKKIMSLVKQLITAKFSQHIQKLLKEALTLVGKDKNAFDPLTKYLDDAMSQLGSSLSDESFTILSNCVWNELIVQLRMTLERQIAAQHDAQAFSCFKQFFNGVRESFGDNVVTEGNEESLTFLDKELQKRGCSPLELIHTYYTTLNEEQEKALETFGILTFLGRFTESGLDLHILNGRNLVPRNGETEPNTFVEVEFYFKDPSRYQMKSMKTKTIDKNQFPLYDEVLKVPLASSEQCMENTIIVFTLFNPDYYGMILNYLGECCVTLKQIKDAEMQQMMRTLWKPHDNVNECLSTLKNRTDKQARDLYKSFNMRCSQSSKNKKKFSTWFNKDTTVMES